MIDAVLTGVDSPNNVNTILVYPNPTNEYVIIKTGDYTEMVDYQLKKINQLGVTVFESIIEEPLYEINLSTWTGKGLYYMQVIDKGSNIIDIKKIILR